MAKTVILVWKGFEHNLLVEGSSNIVIGPNVFDRNPDYRPHDSRNSLLFVDSEDCTLNGLHINHVKGAEAALTLRRCRRFNLTNSIETRHLTLPKRSKVELLTPA